MYNVNSILRIATPLFITLIIIVIVVSIILMFDCEGKTAYNVTMIPNPQKEGYKACYSGGIAILRPTRLGSKESFVFEINEYHLFKCKDHKYAFVITDRKHMISVVFIYEYVRGNNGLHVNDIQITSATVSVIVHEGSESEQLSAICASYVNSISLGKIRDKHQVQMHGICKMYLDDMWPQAIEYTELNSSKDNSQRNTITIIPGVIALNWEPLEPHGFDIDPL